MKEVYTFGRYLRNKFGQNVYKIPISLPGFTCPNIDGSVAVGGCTFCENESFSPNLTKNPMTKRVSLNNFSDHNPLLDIQLDSMELQYKKTATKLANKFEASSFLVYFQSFSNTYAPFDTLKSLYEKALSFDNVIGLSIGTRSDCIEERLLDYLSSLSEDYEIWIEFGIQSIFNETLDAINRGHRFDSIQSAIIDCKSRGLNVCGHLIFGLPNEDSQMMLESLRVSVELGVDSFKFHPLYVVKNTALANDIRNNKFVPINEEEFLDVLVQSIALLPDGVSVQRVSAGIDDETLIAPSWCKNKHQQMMNVRKKLFESGMVY